MLGEPVRVFDRELGLANPGLRAGMFHTRGASPGSRGLDSPGLPRLSAVSRTAGSMKSGRQIQLTVLVSFTATCTGRYPAAAPLCRTTSSKNHDETITASTPADPASASLSTLASSSRNARLTADAVTP